MAIQSTQGSQVSREYSPAHTAALKIRLGNTLNKTLIKEQAALDILENRSKTKKKKSHLPLVTGI